MSRIALLPLLLALAACAPEPRVVPIVGPDGSRMLHVSCGDSEGECYRLAGERCPYGYDVGATIAGAGNMLVRCRAPMTRPVYAPAPYPQDQPRHAPVAATPASTSNAPVPPPPAAPSASSVVVRTLPPAAPPSPRSAPPRVDLGY